MLLVTIDTWRWDHVGVSDRDLVATPNLDRLAAGGTYVPRVGTTCPLTTPAHATILTGLAPRRHGIHDNQHFVLRPHATTLAERFRSAGYDTGAVVSGAPLRRTYGLDRGFLFYDDQGLGVAAGAASAPASRPADETTRRALAWLSARADERPRFLWVHYYDPHEPYDPPEPFRSRYRERPYAGEVAFVDDRLGTLLDAVRKDGARRWIVAVTGDHGEALGDHGEATHGVLLYGSTVDVPLIVVPALPAVPRDGPIGLIDVAPTIADLAGLPPLRADGSSLASGVEPDRWLDAESAYPLTGYGLNPAFRQRRGSLVYLDHGGSEVYDLASDPDEEHDLAGTEGASGFLREATARREAAFGGEAELEPTLSPAREHVEALRSLGYVGGPRPDRRGVHAVDLRRFVADLARLGGARRLAGEGRHAEALAVLDALASGYPASGLIEQERGRSLAALGRLPDAERAWGRALTLDPDDAIAALDLGVVALAKGDLASAERLFKASLAMEEGQPEAHLNLGLLYAYKLNRRQDAKPHLERFLALAPGDPEADKVRALLEAR